MCVFPATKSVTTCECGKVGVFQVCVRAIDCVSFGVVVYVFVLI